MASIDAPPGLKELEERVLRAKQLSLQGGWNAPPPPAEDAHNKGMLSLALRLGTEILAALIVGTFGGVMLDSWLGTKPGFLIVGLIVGIGGGVANIYRAVGGYGYAIGYRDAQEDSDHRQNATAVPPAGPNASEHKGEA